MFLINSSDREARFFLDIDGSPLSDTGFAIIARNHSGSRELHLVDCNNITDSGLISISLERPLLEKSHVSSFTTASTHFQMFVLVSALRV